jgi:hypothetical protein
VAQQHPPIKINQNLTKTFFTQEANFSSYLSPKKKLPKFHSNFLIVQNSRIFAFFPDSLRTFSHRFPPVKPCANENFPYLVILRLGATLTRL